MRLSGMSCPGFARLVAQFGGRGSLVVLDMQGRRDFPLFVAAGDALHPTLGADQSGVSGYCVVP